MTGRKTSSTPSNISPRGYGPTNKAAIMPAQLSSRSNASSRLALCRKPMHGPVATLRLAATAEYWGQPAMTGAPLLHYLPTARHTWRSEVNVTNLPFEVMGVREEGSHIESVRVPIKRADGGLLDTAIPKVVITKDASYWDDYGSPNPEAEVDLIAMIGYMLKSAPLAGFVIEGFTPYGRSASNARTRLMLRAGYSGLPVVRVGRGNTEGFVPLDNPVFIGGSNLTATKARLLLMAGLMKFGALSPAVNPDQPTAEETAAVQKKVAQYHAVFNTH